MHSAKVRTNFHHKSCSAQLTASRESAGFIGLHQFIQLNNWNYSFPCPTGLEQSLHDVETKRLWRRQGDYDSSWDDLGTRRHSVQQVSHVFSKLVYSPTPTLPVSLPVFHSVCLSYLTRLSVSVCPSAYLYLSGCLHVCLSVWLLSVSWFVSQATVCRSISQLVSWTA